jgi:hypothetical protein
MKTDALRPFQELGESVRRAWAAHHFDAENFPEIARHALEQFAPMVDIELEEIARCAAIATTPPITHRFSDLGIRVFNSQEFLIELLVWADGSPSLHEHAFSGAFRVLRGASVQSLFSFSPLRRISHHLHFGEVELLESEILRKDDIREILPGPSLLHSLFHLDNPSVSLVVRTPVDSWWLPQSAVYRPSVALDQALIDDQRVQFAVRSIQAFMRYDVESANRFLKSMVRRFDLPRAVALCISLVSSSALDDTTIHEIILESLGENGDLVSKSVAFQSRIKRCAATRSVLKDRNSRFIVALLSNVPSRARMESLARDLGVEDLYSEMGRVVSELVESGVFGYKLNGNNTSRILRLLLQHEDKADLMKMVHASFDEESINENSSLLEELYHQFHSDPIFQGLYAS